MNMHQKDLEKDFEFVERNKTSLLKTYFNNKYLLIYRQQVVDVFDTYKKAAGAGIRKFGLCEDFLVYHLLDTKPMNFIFNAPNAWISICD